MQIRVRIRFKSVQRTVVSSPGASPHSSDPGWSVFERACRRSEFYARASSNNDCIRQRLPVDLDFYFRHHRQFHNPAAAPARPLPLHAPWPASSRTVAASSWFAVEGALNLKSPTCAQLSEFAPEALAGPPAALAAIARAIRQNRLKLPALRYGAVVFESLTGPLLEPALGRELWDTFQAPVIRQVRGFQGELLAIECEGRQGFHTDPAAGYWEVERSSRNRLLVTSFLNLLYPVARLRTRLAGELDWSVCSCGQSHPLIRNLRSWEASSARPRQLALAAAS
ncbi:MAG: hypothetical protein R2762_05945 [Bryobacteraceae bacterium]